MSEPLEHKLLEVAIFYLYVYVVCACMFKYSFPTSEDSEEPALPSALHCAVLELRSSGLAAVPFSSLRLLARPNIFLKDVSYTSKVLYFIFESPVYLELIVCAEGRGGHQISCCLTTMAH